MRRARSLTVAAVALVVLTAACGDDDGDAAAETETTTTTTPAPTTTTAPPPDARRIDVTAVDFGFETDLTTIEAGLVEVAIANEGAEDHQAMIVRFRDGATFADMAEAAAGDPTGASALGFVEGFGGPNGAAPGESATSRQVLEPGEYLLACFIPSPDGVPHAAKGMVRPFTVTEASTATEAPELEAGDAEVELVDFGFESSGSLPAGGTLRVTNAGEQDHELAMYRLEGDATVADVVRFESSRDGTPPGRSVNGLGLVRVGASATLPLPTAPGRYALVCFVPDVLGDGASHASLGMATEITLEP
jgi:uncharacterized cupredoxin-like copper-binding protein